MAAALVASVVLIELMSKRLWVMVPQSPGVAVAMWIFQPDSARRMRVPPQRISASSGWARKARAVFIGEEGLYSGGKGHGTRDVGQEEMIYAAHSGADSGVGICEHGVGGAE